MGHHWQLYQCITIGQGWTKVAHEYDFLDTPQSLLASSTDVRQCTAGGMVGCAMSLLLEIIMLALYQQSGDRAGNSAAVFFLFLHIGL